MERKDLTVESWEIDTIGALKSRCFFNGLDPPVVGGHSIYHFSLQVTWTYHPQKGHVFAELPGFWSFDVSF